MIVLDVLYTALATILVMATLQIIAYFVTRMMYPPEPKVIYRDVPVHVPAPPTPPPVFTQPPLEELKLPEYEPRQQISTGLRVDPQLPAGLQETTSVRT